MRYIIRISAILILAMLATSCRQVEKQPNILFLFADDWARYAGVYRDTDITGLSDVVKTPNIDRLAREGILFNNAFNPVPSCTPCRGSIITGQYFWRNGRAAFLGGGDWPDAPMKWEFNPKFPNILEYLGYEVGITGKIGVDWWESNYKFYQPEQMYMDAGNKFMNFSQNVMEAQDHDAAKNEIWEEVMGNFRNLLANREEGQPFFYWFGPYHTHRSWVRGSGKELWDINPDDLKGGLPPDWPDVPEIREDVADYLGEVTAFDEMVGLFIKELEDMGELDNTLIVATGDNGMPGFPRAKRNLYDKGVYAPLMIRWGDKTGGGRVVDDFVNLMDLSPTFIEAAGGIPPAAMTGNSLMPIIESDVSGQVDPERDYVVVGRERHVLRYPMRAIRTSDYLYIINYRLEARPKIGDKIENPRQYIFIDGGPTREFLTEHANDPKIRPLFELAFDRRPREELYDLQKDPYQMKNVAKDPKYNETREALKERLLGFMNEYGDARINGDTCVFDFPPHVENASLSKNR
jgi:N-sulfoglucosamine sulfohydrolase